MGDSLEAMFPHVCAQCGCRWSNPAMSCPMCGGADLAGYRDLVLRYLRSLPAGGIAELVGDAMVAEWDPDTLVDLWRCGITTPLPATIDWDDDDAESPWVGSFGAIVLRFPDEPTARAWVETKAKEAGWTIARPKEHDNG